MENGIFLCSPVTTLTSEVHTEEFSLYTKQPERKTSLCHNCLSSTLRSSTPNIKPNKGPPAPTSVPNQLDKQIEIPQKRYKFSNDKHSNKTPKSLSEKSHFLKTFKESEKYGNIKVRNKSELNSYKVPDINTTTEVAPDGDEVIYSTTFQSTEFINTSNFKNPSINFGVSSNVSGHNQSIIDPIVSPLEVAPSDSDKDVNKDQNGTSSRRSKEAHFDPCVDCTTVGLGASGTEVESERLEQNEPYSPAEITGISIGSVVGFGLLLGMYNI